MNGMQKEYIRQALRSETAMSDEAVRKMLALEVKYILKGNDQATNAREWAQLLKDELDLRERKHNGPVEQPGIHKVEG